MTDNLRANVDVELFFPFGDLSSIRKRTVISNRNKVIILFSNFNFYQLVTSCIFKRAMGAELSEKNQPEL